RTMWSCSPSPWATACERRATAPALAGTAGLARKTTLVTRQQLTQQLQPFRWHPGNQAGHARGLSARPSLGRGTAQVARTDPYPEDDRNLAGCRFGRQRRSSTPGTHEDGHSITNQLSRKLR